jgi:anti-anti-sigma factor
MRWGDIGMKVEARMEGKVAVFEPDGFIDPGAANELQSQISNVLHSGCKSIVLSLRQAEFIPSTIIHFLVENHDRLKATGGMLVITGISPGLAHFFRIVEFEAFLNIATSVQAAIETLEAEHPNGSKNRKKAPGIKSIPLSKAEPLPADKVEVSPSLEKSAGSAPMDEESTERFLRKTLPSRLAVEVIDVFVSGGHHTANLKLVAAAVRRDRESTLAMLQRLVRARLLIPLERNSYHYEPSSELNRQVRQFLMHWHNAHERQRLSKLLIRIEEEMGRNT